MFKRSILSKFEWENLPEPLNELFVENLIYSTDTQNFAVVRRGGFRDFWGGFFVQTRETDYGIPTSIICNTFRGTQISAQSDDFILFNPYNYGTTPLYLYVKAYTAMIASINTALKQHIAATQLIAHIYASTQSEREKLEKIYKNIPGVKIVDIALDGMLNDQKLNFIQFDVTPRSKELEDLKHELETDLFMRCGISNGIELTHITDSNLKDSEQARDLFNAYELKLRENFCNRYNEWKKPDKPLKVKIHTITHQNAIEKDTIRENISNE